MTDIADDLESGTDIEALAATRRVLAARLLDAEGSAAAAISRELRAVLAELRRLGAGREESAVDEIAARRARRRAGGPAGAEDPQRPASGDHSRPGGV